eukprot:TRINITY_DN8383_c0_g1_i3.p1 TRINITY_DN8383_c0_g1~~TRINITY_DN8383_c0_g1_i3.p1  ORF type:complete len:404 (+),score=93.15 TRINITY_DN8383_c0_g1_i3:70-1281(+)
MTTLGPGNTPTLLESAGFKVSKTSANGKESIYTITRGRCGLLLAFVIAFVFAFCFGVGVQTFELHFERRGSSKALKRAARRSRKAAARLAKVEMELWAHYQDDTSEASTVSKFVENMNASYTSLLEELNLEISHAANVSNLSPSKAGLLSARIIEQMVDHRRRTTNDVQSLLDKIIATGRKSEALKSHVEQDSVNEVQQYADETKDATREIRDVEELDELGHYLGDTEEGHVNDEENEDLAHSVTAFFDIYDEFSARFPGPYPELAAGTPTMRSLKSLADEIEDGLSPEETEARLQKLHLETMKLEFKKNTNSFTKDVRDYVETLAIFDRIPRSKISEWIVSWRNGKDNFSYEMWTKLVKLKKANRLPNNWFVRIAVGMQKHDMDEAESVPTDNDEQDMTDDK